MNIYVSFFFSLLSLAEESYNSEDKVTHNIEKSKKNQVKAQNSQNFKGNKNKKMFKAKVNKKKFSDQKGKRHKV